MSVINFSSDAQKGSSYHQDPKKLEKNLELKQIGQGTDFGKAISAALEAMKSLTSKDFVIIFMSDGEALYPDDELTEIKAWLKNDNRKLEFFVIGFECTSNVLSNMCSALGGKDY